jgi:hypothetical protein
MPPKRKVAPSEIFLSHSTKNDVFIGRLQTVLTDHGVKTFVSKTSIRSGQQWHDEIGTALKRCDWFLLVLSPQSVRSAWVKHELIYALQANRYRGRIIPVVYKNCDLGPSRRSSVSIFEVILTKGAGDCWISGSET